MQIPTDDDLKARAIKFLENKPTFRFLGMRRPTHVWKDKAFKVKCLDCGTIEQRNLGWLKSKYGCQCTRGLKISKTNQMSGAEYSDKWRLSNRKLRLASDFCGMHQTVEVECLRCGNLWTTAPCNLRTAGCPKCAPDLMRKRCMRKYGVEYSLQRPDVQRKIRSTMKKRYGVEHALQNPQLLAKSLATAYSTTEYRLGRRTVRIQGYEHFALDLLLSEGLAPTSIECGLGNINMPTVPYYYNGKHRVYHPDIFVPHLNTIIEVKSRYTLKARLSATRSKRKACMEAGYVFRCLVFSRNGSLKRDI